MTTSRETTPDTPQRDEQSTAGSPRPVRATADEPVPTRLTVNGTPAELELPPRHTLADALRDHLGLTGTHLGCEHGVCGMCTVLVDGQAARSCLLFACQLDGSDVLTVEGLGRPDELHPLQDAFGQHHALQCGFCTPGFLMSSYDLLSHHPGLSTEQLPEELSGVLCRCTGYRNIVAAVADTNREYPNGIPPAGNCAQHVLVGRSGGQSPGIPGGAAGTAGEPSERGASQATTIVLPDSEPTVTVDVTSMLTVTIEQVWGVLNDLYLLARCLPGAELTDELGDDQYAGQAQVAVGPIKLTFTGVAHLITRDRQNQTLRVLAHGRDTGGAQTQAAITLTTQPRESGSQLHAEAALYLTGRIAQFGRALAGDISHRLFEQFAHSVQQAATSEHAPTRSPTGPSALSLLLGTVRTRLRRAWRRVLHRHARGPTD